MVLVHTVEELHANLGDRRDIILVPTMGNLHAGHLSLLALARSRGGCVVASIFVNRLQFAPHEDFDQYPRTLRRDCELLADAGCDLVFAPDERAVYPEPQTFKVLPDASLADTLEGSVRPGFFTGVCTVVMKLFNLTRPTAAVFGKKDYQQLLVIRHMIRQFALPIELIAAETVRDPSGLARSSRNSYLTAVERPEAPHLNSALCTLAAAVRAGRRDWAALEGNAAQYLAARGWVPEYFSVRNRSDLSAAREGQSWVALAAARLGRTRLIDNVEL